MFDQCQCACKMCAFDSHYACDTNCRKTKRQRRAESLAMHKCPDCGNVAGLDRHRCRRCEQLRQERDAEARRRQWVDEQMQKKNV